MPINPSLETNHKKESKMGRMVSFASSVLDWVDAHKKPVDTAVAMLLALIPILQHYLGIVDNAATTVLVLLLPY